MENSLLRMADNLVEAEMKIEELEKKCDEKTQEAEMAKMES